MTQTPKDFAAWIASAFQETKRRVEAANEQSAKDAIAAARKLSHGPFTTKYLRTLYNPRGPYSKRDPHPPGPREEINIQEGLFARSWETRDFSSPSESFFRVQNEAPYADYLAEGTDKMIRRPLIDSVSQSIRPKRIRLINDALDLNRP